MHAERWVKWVALGLWLGLVASGCKRAEPVALRAGSAGELVALDPALLGVSGLGLDPQGRIWVVTERTRELVRLERESKAWKVAERRKVAGSSELDLEAIDWVSAATIALGTEGRGERRSDRIELVHADGSLSKVIEVDWQAGFSRSAPDNQGIEGLCALEDRLVVAGESVEPRDGARRSPILVVQGEQQRPFWLRLTSERGKISGLSCSGKGSEIEVLAVERHFETARVIRFVIELEAKPRSEIEAELWLDFAPMFLGKIPNFEGLARLQDGRLFLVADNDYGGRSGETWLLVLEPPASERPPAAVPTKPVDGRGHVD